MVEILTVITYPTFYVFTNWHTRESVVAEIFPTTPEVPPIKEEPENDESL